MQMLSSQMSCIVRLVELSASWPKILTNILKGTKKRREKLVNHTSVRVVSEYNHEAL